MEFNNKIIERLKKQFDEIVHIEESENIEFWYARDLQIKLGYTQWRNFEDVISKAILSCENAEIRVQDHFAKVSKMIAIAKGAKR